MKSPNFDVCKRYHDEQSYHIYYKLYDLFKQSHDTCTVAFKWSVKPKLLYYHNSLSGLSQL